MPAPTSIPADLIYEVQTAHAHFEAGVIVVDVVTAENEVLQLRMAPMIGLSLAHEEERAFFRRPAADDLNP